MSKSIQTFILKTGTIVVFGLFGLISLYLFLLSIFTTCFMVYTDEHVYYLKDFAIVMCAGLVGLSACLTIVKHIWNRKWKKYSSEERESKTLILLKSISLWITIIVGLCMIAFILHMQLPPIYDQSMVYYSTGQLLQGNYAQWKMGEYFSMLPYQNGMVLMMCPFVWIFQEDAAIILQLYNVPMLFLGYWGISKLAGNYFGKKNMYLTYIALVMVIPMWTMVTFVYGLIPAMCLGIWSIYFEVRFEKTGEWKYIIASGTFLFFSIMWKSNSQIFAIVLCAMLLVNAIKQKGWKFLGGIIIILFFTFLEIKGIPLVMHWITGENTTNGIPMTAWLAMGLQESGIAPGWYNEFPMNLYRHVSSNPNVIKAEVAKSFQESIVLFMQEKDYMFRFFARKIASMWTDPAFQFFTTVNTRNLYGEFSYAMKDFFYNGGIMNTIMYLLLDGLQSIEYFGLILFFILKRKELSLEKAHLIVAILGGYLFHFIGEAKSHYVLPYYIMMVPYVVEGYRMMILKMVNVDWKDKKQRYGLLKLVSVKWGMLLAVLVIMISFMKGPIVENTLKLGTDESEYIWYCTNELQWKEDSYSKS